MTVRHVPDDRDEVLKLSSLLRSAQRHFEQAKMGLHASAPSGQACQTCSLINLEVDPPRWKPCSYCFETTEARK